MAIFGTDERILVADEDVTTPPYNSVVAVDSRDENSPKLPRLGSGIAIGANHVLTAAHVVTTVTINNNNTDDNDIVTINDVVPQRGGRILLPEQLQPGDGSSFPPRSKTLISPADDNVKFAEREDLLPSPESALINDSDFNIIEGDNDIALLNLTSDSPDITNRAMGIITFTNEFDLSGIDIPASERIQVSTAGYPGLVQIDELSVSKNEPFITFENGVTLPFSSNAFRTDATQMFADEGTITLALDGTLNIAELDVEKGQSGSGIWTILEGDSDPRVLGVLSTVTDQGSISDRVDGALITPEIYYGIVERMEEDDQGLVDGNELPEKEGNDSLYGQNGNDSLYGEAGEDRLEGGNNSDRLGGGAGQDTLKGDGGHDFLSGGGDNDTIIGGDGNDRLFGVDGNDLIYGSNGADRLAGGNNSDRLFGGNGVDVLKGDRGNDLLYGGNNNDTLIGGDNNDNLYGQNNNDRIFGENGNDRLEGGNGSDTLTGGGGLDDFVFASTNQPADEITDFTVEDDTLVFVASGFAGIATLGMVSVDMFTIGSNPSTTSHRFIYSAGSGELFYDQDGTGNSAKVKLADLDAGLPLTNSDFVII